MAHRVFRMRITPERAPLVHRTIDFDGRHTLHDVHLAIQREFDLDDGHLHAFYLSGQYWDANTERRGVEPGNDPCPCGTGRKFKKCCGAA